MILLPVHSAFNTNIKSRGVSNGLASTFRLAAGAIVTAIYSSIETSHYSTVIPGKIKEAAASSNFTGSVEKLLIASGTNTPATYIEVPGMNPQVMAAAMLAVRNSYIDAFRLVFLVAIGFGCIAIIAALCTRTVAATQKSGERAVVLENEHKKTGIESKEAEYSGEARNDDIAL
jgi:Fungal trichothecene efflux pump (TRI12)